MRVGRNPALRTRDPAALRKVRLARHEGYMERLNETAQDWMLHVRRLRPDIAWEDVLRIIDTALSEVGSWTQSLLLRAVNAYLRDFLSEAVVGRARRRATDCPPSSRVLKLQILTSRYKPFATDCRRCASGRHEVSLAGNHPQLKCFWSEHGALGFYLE